MTSRNSAKPETANATTAADEINRFVRYVDFRTRDLKETFETYLGINPPNNTVPLREEDDEDEDLFLDVGPFEDVEGWVDVADEAIEVPEDASQQKFHPAPPPPPGPIQQTTVATQRAALQALGLTGLYLEFGLRLVAEDVGWLTRTATFEDAVRKVQRRFPVLARLGESYGKGAKKEDERRRSGSGAGSRPPPGLPERGRTLNDGAAAAAASRRLTEEEVGRFAELEEVPLEREDDEWDEVCGEA